MIGNLVLETIYSPASYGDATHALCPQQPEAIVRSMLASTGEESISN